MAQQGHLLGLVFEDFVWDCRILVSARRRRGRLCAASRRAAASGQRLAAPAAAAISAVVPFPCCGPRGGGSLESSYPPSPGKGWAIPTETAPHRRRQQGNYMVKHISRRAGAGILSSMIKGRGTAAAAGGGRAAAGWGRGGGWARMG